ncbi:MAG: hypothetical protein GF384_08660, partial [Elusimicrobia bacterium]|nr:hypothetical protein [Elusimicrobiota bacterium]
MRTIAVILSGMLVFQGLCQDLGAATCLTPPSIGSLIHKHSEYFDPVIRFLAQRDYDDPESFPYGWDSKTQSPREQADILMVLGCPDLRLFETAVDFFINKKVAKKMLIAGGIGGRYHQPLIDLAKAKNYRIAGDVSKLSEAEIIKQIIQQMARDRGGEIHDQDIILETESTNTPQNFEKSVIKLKKEGIVHDTIIYMQTPLQQLRTKLTMMHLNNHHHWNIKHISYAPYIPDEYHTGDYAWPGEQEFNDIWSEEMKKLIDYTIDLKNPEIQSPIASLLSYCRLSTIKLEELYDKAQALARERNMNDKAKEIGQALLKLKGPAGSGHAKPTTLL